MTLSTFDPRTTQRTIAALGAKVHDLRTSLTPTNATVTLHPKRIVVGVSGSGELVYALSSLAPVSFPQQYQGDLPARIGRAKDGSQVKLTGLDAIQSLVERGSVWESYPDQRVWDEALRAAQELALDGQGCRELSSQVVLALAARRGCTPDKWSLP
jgi:hypothetical protein